MLNQKRSSLNKFTLPRICGVSLNEVCALLLGGAGMESGKVPNF